MARRRISVATSVVQQVRTAAKITSLETERLARAGIIRAIDPVSGRHCLKVSFPRAQASPQEVDLSFLLELPHLTDFLLEGFRLWAGNKSESSRTTWASQLRYGLVTFLIANCLQAIAPNSLDEVLFTAFIKWLDRPDAGGGKPLAHSSRRRALGAVTAAVEALIRDGRWETVARRIAEALPKRSWPGIGRKGIPIERLARNHLAAINAAAEKEILEISARWHEGHRLLELGRQAVAAGSCNYMDLCVCLAAIEQRYQGIIGNLTAVYKDDRNLCDAVRYHGRAKLGSYFYASARDLIPFVIALGIATVQHWDAIRAEPFAY